VTNAIAAIEHGLPLPPGPVIATASEAADMIEAQAHLIGHLLTVAVTLSGQSLTEVWPAICADLAAEDL